MSRNKILIPPELTILLLEDMPDIRQTMLNHLSSIGVENKVIEAPTVKSAIEALNKETIGFIISDWNLPDGTGFEFLKKLRATKKFSKTPFLMCTTMDEVEDMINAINEGANEYLVKPWKKSELFEKLNSCWKTANEK